MSGSPKSLLRASPPLAVEPAPKWGVLGSPYSPIPFPGGWRRMKAVLPQRTHESLGGSLTVGAGRLHDPQPHTPAPAILGCAGAGGGAVSCARPLPAGAGASGCCCTIFTLLSLALSCAPGRKGGRGRKGGPWGCAGSGTQLWQPPSPIRPRAQPGSSTSHALLSRLAQASGKLGQVPWAGPGSPVPIPPVLAATTVLPLPAGQAAWILPSCFPGIPGLQAGPAVAVAGDVPHGHPVPLILMTAGNVP